MYLIEMRTFHWNREKMEQAGHAAEIQSRSSQVSSNLELLRMKTASQHKVLPPGWVFLVFFQDGGSGCVRGEFMFYSFG